MYVTAIKALAEHFIFTNVEKNSHQDNGSARKHFHS